MTRSLGIDFGEKRIGLALSDPTGTIASPLSTIHRRRGKRVPLKAVEEVAREHGVQAVVVGLPLDLEGNENAWCAEVRAAGDELARRLDVPVSYVDERMTSVRAQRAVRSIGLPRAKRKEKARIDAAAAALVLQSWLDGTRGP